MASIEVTGSLRRSVSSTPFCSSASTRLSLRAAVTISGTSASSRRVNAVDSTGSSAASAAGSGGASLRSRAKMPSTSGRSCVVAGAVREQGDDVGVALLAGARLRGVSAASRRPPRRSQARRVTSSVATVSDASAGVVGGRAGSVFGGVGRVARRLGFGGARRRSSRSSRAPRRCPRPGRVRPAAPPPRSSIACVSSSFDAGTINGTGPVVGGEAHELVGAGRPLQLGRDVDRDQPGALEHLQQAVAAVGQLLDVLARQLRAALEIGQHALAIGPRLGHHLAALLLGVGDLGLGVALRLLAVAGRLDLGVLAHAVGLVVGFAHHARGVLLGPHLDLRGRLARRLEHPQRLLAEHAGDGLVVELGAPRRRRPGGPQLGLELPLALLQPPQLGGDRREEGAHLVGIEATTGRGEPGLGHGRGRGRVRTRQRGTHSAKRKQPAPPGRGNQASGADLPPSRSRGLPAPRRAWTRG